MFWEVKVLLALETQRCPRQRAGGHHSHGNFSTLTWSLPRAAPGRLPEAEHSLGSVFQGFIAPGEAQGRLSCSPGGLNPLHQCSSPAGHRVETSAHGKAAPSRAVPSALPLPGAACAPPGPGQGSGREPSALRAESSGAVRRGVPASAESLPEPAALDQRRSDSPDEGGTALESSQPRTGQKTLYTSADWVM